MTGRLQGKVALISGAARGQGRSHAVRFAQEGANIIAFDICAPIATAPYDMATVEDLKETARLVEAEGGHIVWTEADVRNLVDIEQLVTRGVSEFGRLDIVCANAAFTCFVENTWSITEDQWEELIAVNLTGVWKTVKAAAPSMIAAGNGGSIAITSSSAGTKGMINLGHYSTAKHGVVGLMRTLANELAEHGIRVNTIHPTGVDTKLLDNEHIQSFLEANPSWGDNMQNALPVELLDPVDISNAILFLASDEARYITGVTFPVDAGFAIR
jgi:SDR family mycofactocin-dependent oxidoreductase